MTTENWLPIPGHPDYSVSDHGRVRRDHNSGPRGLKPGTLLKQIRGRYIGVKLHGKNADIHRLILMAFVGPSPSAKHHAAHWDGDKTNNHVGNLRWATPTENGADTIRHGRSNRGEKNGRVRLTADQVREIRRAIMRGERGSDIGEEYNVHFSTVSAIRRGVSWAWLVDAETVDPPPAQGA